MNINKINLSPILNLALLGIAIIIALNIYQKQADKIAKIDMLKKEQEKKNEIIMHIAELKQKADLYKETFKQRERRQNFNTITNIARVTGLKVISLKPIRRGRIGEDSVYGKSFFEFNIQIDSYHQLGEFISKLESRPEIFTIEELSLKIGSRSAAGLASRPHNIRVELIISETFFRE